MNQIESDRRTVMTAMGASVALAASGMADAADKATPATGPNQGPAPLNAVWNWDEVALLLIDYQPQMLEAVRSETPPDLIVLNTIFMIRIAKALNVPIVLSEVGVKLGVNSPVVPAIANELPGVKPIDRDTMNAWEDPDFRRAVEATGKKRLIFGALFTEICLAFPVVNTLKEGYQVMFVEDMVGGESPVAHKAGIARVTQAGAIPNSAIGLAAELFRNWTSRQGHAAKPVILWYFDELKKRGLH